MTAEAVAHVVFWAVTALAVGVPAGLGWRGHGLRGLAGLVLFVWALEVLAAVPLYRADQECLATPGCGSWSGIVWTLLIGVGAGYPLVAAVLVGVAAWARRTQPDGAQPSPPPG